MNIAIKANPALNLRICGGNDHSIEELRATRTPQPTDSWNPIAHGLLVDEFTRQAQDANLEIVNSVHTLAREGQRYFGLFHVRGINRANNDEVGTVIGLRNSHDKAFAASICAGDAPFVCTNLIFSNEIVLGRKHTTFIMRDLPQLIARAIGQLGSHWARQDARIETYRGYTLTDTEAHHLTIQAFRNGAISKTQIADVVGQWHAPEHDEFADRNGWSFYNAFTNVYRGNLAALNKRSDALHGTLDLAFGLN